MTDDLRERARKGRRLSYYNAEFVVALKHLECVKQTLEECHVRFGDVKTSPDLGLALIGLSDDKEAADNVGEVLGREKDQAGRAATASDPDPSQTDLDRFMSGLRELFATRSAGWAPTLGKNRLVGDVIGGVGKVSHGGGEVPTGTDKRLAERSERAEAGLGKGVRVGVLDTSISSHEWLAGGWVSPPDDVLPVREKQTVAAGHATFVAGLVLSQAPACVVEARSVLSDDFGQATSWDAANAIVQIGKTRPDVLNLSFACYTEDGQAPLALAAAIDRLDSGTVVVAAAGNHGDLPLEGQEWDEDDRRKPAWPAALDNVVAIGAVSRAGGPASFTPPDVQWIDAMALGEEVVSTFVTASVNVADDDKAPAPQPFHGWASWSGTSFSAALVSGCIAAKTVPGQVSARQAWDDTLHKAWRRPPAPPVVGLPGPVL